MKHLQVTITVNSETVADILAYEYNNKPLPEGLKRPDIQRIVAAHYLGVSECHAPYWASNLHSRDIDHIAQWSKEAVKAAGIE